MAADWSRLLIGPIPLPDGRALRNLRDAAECVLRIPETPASRVAAERIIDAALNGGNMFAAHAAIRLAVFKANMLGTSKNVASVDNAHSSRRE